MKRVAITGAGGMIGRHLIEALKPTGVGLRGLLLPDERIPPDFEAVEIFRGDICSARDLANLFQDVDVVFHLAALVGRDANQAAIERAREVNVGGTRRVVEGAIRAQVGRLVFLSTCCVYGLYGRVDDVLDESASHAPLPLPYDVTKTEAERIITDTRDLAWSVLQIPVALGGGLTANKPAIASLVRLARLGLAPRPWTGETWVNYVYGRDVAEALIALASHSAAVGQTFIYSESVRFSEFLSWIGDELGHKVHDLPVPGTVLDIAAMINRSAAVLGNRRRFSAQKIRDRLAYAPSVGLRQGLTKTLHHYVSAGLIS